MTRVVALAVWASELTREKEATETRIVIDMTEVIAATVLTGVNEANEANRVIVVSVAIKPTEVPELRNWTELIGWTKMTVMVEKV